MEHTRSLFVYALTLVMSCSQFTVDPAAAVGPSDGAVRPPDGADDKDASSDGTRDASRDAGGNNLHPQGTFNGPDCGRWVGYQASLSYVAHDGGATGGSCQATYRGQGAIDKTFQADDDRAIFSVSVGQRFRVRALTARCSPSDGDLYVGINARIRAKGAEFSVLQPNRSDIVSLADAWRSVSVEFTVEKAGDLNVSVESTVPMAAQSACFRFDDVVVERL
jgi:hypothetical protein